MVDRESRAALWTLISIYRRLLAVIQQNVEAAETRSAALTDVTKISIAMRAVAMRFGQYVGREPAWRLLA
jgi:hypothetical protein